MTKTSSKVKAKYNAKAYDKIGITVRKESEINKEVIKERAEKLGFSVNNYITNLIKNDINNN